MSVTSKLIVSCFAVLGVVLLVRHGASALTPAVPQGMPNAVFIPAGYNPADNEMKGEWIACNNHPEEGTVHCRVTDGQGTVIFQGEFLPLDGSPAMPSDQLRIATSGKADIWVEGPTEAGPVPVIPLANGELLVPSDDVYALTVRWRDNPDELRRLSSQ